MQPRDGRAGLSQMRARLEAFREYAEIVVAQDAAVAAGEMEEAARLAVLREELQQRLDYGGDLASDASPPAPSARSSAREPRI